MRRSRWPPRRGQRVYSFGREKAGEQPEGWIVFVDRDYADPDMNQITVRYEGFATIRTNGAYVLSLNDDVLWDARDLDAFLEKYPPETRRYEYTWIGEVWEEEDSSLFQTYNQMDFQGCWSSSAGGRERWEIE